jgi:hypothetical protein
MSEFEEDEAWREMGRRRFEAASAAEDLVYERLMNDLMPPPLWTISVQT